MYRCPNKYCGSTDRLRIQVPIMVLLTQPDDNPENFETEIIYGDHEWDESSLMECVACDHRGTVADFIVEADEGETELDDEEREDHPPDNDDGGVSDIERENDHRTAVEDERNA